MRTFARAVKSVIDRSVLQPVQRNVHLVKVAGALYLVPAIGVLFLVVGFDFESTILGGTAESVSFDPSDRPRVGDLIATNFFVNALLISGAALLGVMTIAILLANGIMHGYGFAQTILTTGSLTTSGVLWIHALVELPAIWIAGAAGLKLPYHVVTYVTRRSETLITDQIVFDTIVLIVLAFVVMFVAAFIESYLMVWLADVLYNRN